MSLFLYKIIWLTLANLMLLMSSCAQPESYEISIENTTNFIRKSESIELPLDTFSQEQLKQLTIVNEQKKSVQIQLLDSNSDGNFDYLLEVNNPEDNYFSSLNIGSYHALTVGATGLDSLQDFAELSININNLPANITLQEIQFAIDDIDRGSDLNTREVVSVIGYNGTIPISPKVTAQQTGFLVVNPPTTDQWVTTTTTTSDNLPFMPGDSNASGTAEQAAIDITFNAPIDKIVIRYSQTGALSNGGVGIRQVMGMDMIQLMQILMEF